MNTKSLNKLKTKFTYSPQNWAKLVELWKTDQRISFYSWECPPRQVKEDLKNGKWVNFDIDIKSVVKGNKLDEFTELPRLTSQVNEEQWLINILKTNPKARYVKIVADTNGLYLYPKSKLILGQKRLNELSIIFKELLEIEALLLFGKDKPKVILYTKLLQDFQNDYEIIFNQVCKSFKRNKSSLVPNKIINLWSKRILKHVGLNKQDYNERLDLLKRVIASYIAEGIIFDLLDKSGNLPNPVWANWEEPPNNVTTTEVYRKKLGLSPIPVIYFVKKEVLS